MKTAAVTKSDKPSFPTIRHDLLDRLTEKAEQLTRPVPKPDKKAAPNNGWAA